mgnify:CR=1 FL=1
MDGVVADRAQLTQVDLSIGQNAFVGRDVDDTSCQMAACGIIGEKFALERHGQFVDHRGIDVRRRSGMKSCPGEFVGDFVPGDDTRIVAGCHLIDRSHADGEGTCYKDVFRGFMPGGETDPDCFISKHTTPSGIHDIGHTLLVVGCHNQYGHRIEPTLRSKVFLHIVCEISP